MKASKLIAELQELIDEFGDLEVVDDGGAPVDYVHYSYDHDDPQTPSPVFEIVVQI